jgi:hypothetical protein
MARQGVPVTTTVSVIGAVFAVALFLDGFLRWFLNHTPQSGLSIVDSVRAKRLGGRDQLELFDRALTTGVVPPGADVPRWSRELARWNPRRALAPDLVLSWLVVCGFLWRAATWAIPKSFNEILASHTVRWTSGLVAAGVLLLVAHSVWRRLRHPGESTSDERKRLRATLDREIAAHRVETAAYRVVSERRPIIPLAGRRYRS